MTERIDFTPAADSLMTAVAAVKDEHLDLPTPCFGHSVGELLQHLVTVTRTLRATAEKDFGPLTQLKLHSDEWPALEDGWRAALEEQVPQLVQAWREESAWQGRTEGGDLDVPAPVAGRIVIDEVVLHGWDLSRAIGQDYVTDPDLADSYRDFIESLDDGGMPHLAGSASSSVAVGDDAPLLERLIVLSGRDPYWSPS